MSVTPLMGPASVTASPRSGTPLYSVPDAPLVYCSLRSALASGDQGPPVQNVDHQSYATFRDCNARRIASITTPIPSTLLTIARTPNRRRSFSAAAGIPPVTIITGAVRRLDVSTNRSTTCTAFKSGNA